MNVGVVGTVPEQHFYTSALATACRALVAPIEMATGVQAYLEHLCRVSCFHYKMAPAVSAGAL
ncbi:MAG: hypothetical protein J6C37_11680 [Roseburia sp.]|nr:hypothetical protein [Roseburia sp.]